MIANLYANVDRSRQMRSAWDQWRMRYAKKADGSAARRK